MSSPIANITHIEIRRVQNGFVVMGVDYRRPDYNSLRDMLEEPQRVSYVASDIEALKAVMETIINGAEVKWLPTTDIPMLDMNKRIVDQQEKALAEQRAQQTMGAFTAAFPTATAIAPGQLHHAVATANYPTSLVGGPLNRP